MKKDTEKTAVHFLIEKGEECTEANVFAFFPLEYFTHAKDNRRTCYAHIGQHSECSIEYAKECHLAPYAQYKALKIELEGLGYDLEIREHKAFDMRMGTAWAAFRQILCPLDTHRGAPMGRADNGSRPANGRIYTRAVPLIDGYDKGGAYWGYPSNLFVEYTKDLQYIHFFRK